MNEQILERFREKIRDCNVFGPFMKTCDPAFVEAAGYAGFDFAILDMEHGPITIENLQNNIRAAQIAGILPVVRVPAITEEAISKVLDIGAAGIQIPQVTCAGEAEKAVQMAKYHPLGERGVCRFVRAAHYSSLPREQYFPAANKALVVIQVEGLEAIRNIDKIIAVEGVDIVFIGPYDLSQSLGLPGQIDHPNVVSAMEKIIESAKSKGVPIGTFCDSPQTLEMWIEAGVRYLSYSVDVGIFLDACRSLQTQFHLISKS